jgi:hypothetical protein
MADDSIRRYTFEDDADFSTQISDTSGLKPLGWLDLFSPNGEIALKVADGSSSAAQFTNSNGKGSVYSGDAITVSGLQDFSILAKIKVNGYVTDDNTQLLVWVQTDAGTPGFIPQIAIGFLHRSGSLYLDAYFSDETGTQVGVYVADIGTVISPDTYYWVLLELNRTGNTVTLYIDAISIDSADAAGFGAIEYASGPVLGVSGPIVTIGAVGQPILTVSDIRLFNRVLVGDERIGIFNGGGGMGGTIIDPTSAQAYKTYDVTVTAGNTILATKDGEAMFFHLTKNFSGLAGKKITFIDSAGKKAVAYGYQNGGGEALGSELITTPINSLSQPFETFLTSGIDISSAINTAGLGVCSVNMSDILGRLVYIGTNCTLNSGTGPRLTTSRESSASTNQTIRSALNGLWGVYRTFCTNPSNGREDTGLVLFVADGVLTNFSLIWSCKPLTNVPATGMLLCSTRTGSTRNMESVETGFNPNAVVTVRVENAPVIIDPSKSASNFSSLLSGLVGWWPLSQEYQPGALVLDRSAYSNHGTPTNITYTTDRLGRANRAASFNGASSFVDLSSVVLARAADTKGTIILSIKVTGIKTTEYFFSLGDKDQAVTTDKFYLYTSAGVPYFALYSGGTFAISINANAGTDIRNTWVRLGITQDGSTSKMYINGVAQTDTDSGEWLANINNIDYANVGRRVFSTSDVTLSTCLVREITWYNRGLTADEMVEDYMSDW